MLIANPRIQINGFLPHPAQIVAFAGSIGGTVTNLVRRNNRARSVTAVGVITLGKRTGQRVLVDCAAFRELSDDVARHLGVVRL